MDENSRRCRGIVVKANFSEGFYIYNNGTMSFQKRRQLNILKKKSCLGCEDCKKYFDELDKINNDWPIKNFDSIKNKHLYRLKMEENNLKQFYLEEINEEN